MKRRCIAMLAACILLYMPDTKGQVKQKLDIKAAIIYLTGASLISSAEMSIPKGEEEVIFMNVANNINAASLIVSASNGVVAEAATFQNNCTVPQIPGMRIKAIQDSIDLLTQNRSLIMTKIDVADAQLEILDDSHSGDKNEKNMPVAELVKLLDLVGNRMSVYVNEKNKYEALKQKIDARLERLRQEIYDEQRKDILPGGMLLVRFYSQSATSSLITVSYAMPGAGWTPTYDIMADALNMPIKLYYKANVYQNSGIKWDNVQLSLSSGNPSESVQAPVINPWYLSLQVPVYEPPGASLKEVVVRAYKKPLVDMDKPSSMMLSRDEITSNEMPRRNYNHYIDPGTGANTYIVNAGTSSITNYTSVNSTGVNTTFDIDLPYSIPSDGKQHMVTIKKYEMPATYRYYAVPKLDKDAFLQAQMTSWEDMNLLPGQTNIFYEGRYVGQGHIGGNNPADTMIISLGRDKKIIIKRENDKTLRSVKMIGSNVRETFAYTITIRNTRKEKINLVVQDQAPVSNDKDILIEDLNANESNMDESTGVVNWSLTQQAGEIKKLSLAYTIKYPKGVNVLGLH